MYAAVVHQEDRRTLHSQTIQQANSVVMRVPLHSFQSSMNACVVSPMSDRSEAHRVLPFCNCYDIVRKTDCTYNGQIVP